MGALNQYFKKKWIKKLMEEYKMPQEKAKLVMDGVDKEATRDLKEAINKLSKNLKPSDNNDFSKDLDIQELKRRRKELIDHPERGIKLKDL